MTGATEKRKRIYIAHAYGGNPENLVKARKWLEWARGEFPECDVIAPWIEECERTPETPENREAGLLRCEAVVATCNELWVCGKSTYDTLSQGLKREIAAATSAQVRFIPAQLRDKLTVFYLKMLMKRETAHLIQEIVKHLLDYSDSLKKGQ